MNVKIFNRSRKTLGQSAVEAMFAIPVMLLVYLVGAQMWSMTWNAQYAHIKARYDVHEQAAHKPCYANPGNGTSTLIPTPKTVTATTRQDMFYGSRYTVTSARNMKATYRIVCNS